MQFGDKDFDSVKYINERFPDEQSLCGLDSEILNLKN